MLCYVDPSERPAAHPVMSADLQAVLGAIQRGTEKRLEVLKEKKRQLEISDIKLKLVGHVELDKKGELLKMEAEPEELDEDTEGGGAPKRRVTQSIVSIRDAKWKENIEKQEWRWFALTGKKSTASASLGAPTEETAEGTAPTGVTSTTEGDTVDLEAAMLSQGDDDDDVYGKKYRTTSEQIGVWQGQGKRKTVTNKRKNVRQCNTLKLNYGKRSRNIKSKRHRRHC